MFFAFRPSPRVVCKPSDPQSLPPPAEQDDQGEELPPGVIHEPSKPLSLPSPAIEGDQGEELELNSNSHPEDHVSVMISDLLFPKQGQHYTVGFCQTRKTSKRSTSLQIQILKSCRHITYYPYLFLAENSLQLGPVRFGFPIN